MSKELAFSILFLLERAQVQVSKIFILYLEFPYHGGGFQRLELAQA